MPDLALEWRRAMRDGDYERAWSLSERALAERDPGTRDDPALPYHLRWVWDGRPFDGRHVLVRCYHGLGDTIQFVRYLPRLRARAASVTLEVQPRLQRLLAQVPGIDRIIAFDPADPAPPGECDIEIMELGFALREPPTDVPPPYLQWPKSPLKDGVIGLCFEAGDWDDTRSIPAARLRSLCEGRPCITLVSAPTNLPVLNPEGCPHDIEASAALVAGVDLVITVDTMIAHLAGAMGKPTWLLLKADPDWRWTPQRARSDWYPSMRLLAQQTPGDWAGVIVRVERDLQVFLPSAKSPQPWTTAPLPSCPCLGASS